MSNLDNYPKITPDTISEISSYTRTLLTGQFKDINQKAVDSIVNYMGLIGMHWSSLGLHFIVPQESAQTSRLYAYLMVPYITTNLPTLLALTDNLSEYSSIPVSDTTHESYTHNGNSFTVTEDQPLDATENITTPFIKNKSNAGYSAEKTVSHSTANEALTRQKISDGTVKSLYAFTEGMMKQFVYEYNVAY